MSLTMIKQKWFPSRDTTTSFAGKNIIVTGANSGIGFEAAVKYSALGASKVILGVRSVQKGETAKSAIEGRTHKTGQLEVWEVDMCSYDSIQKFAERASKELDHLDIAVLNAGVTVPEYRQSKYRWEETLQVNTLSTSLLAFLLLPKLRASKTAASEPVLEIVGSSRHYAASIPASHKDAILTSFNAKSTYNVHVNYAISKFLIMSIVGTLANITSKNVKEPDVVITAVCPGAANTNLAREFDAWYFKLIVPIFLGLFSKSAEAGSRIIVSGTTLGAAGNGKFWYHDQIRPDPPLLQGEEGEKLREQIWTEVIGALRKDVGSIDSIIEAAKGPKVAPPPSLRRSVKPASHATSSLLRYIFPSTRTRARAQLSRFRHETIPNFKHRAQSRICRYILYRQATKLKKAKDPQSIIQQLRSFGRHLLRPGPTTTSNRDDVVARRRMMNQSRGSNGYDMESSGAGQDMGGYRSEGREPGARRKKLAGYLKAANELRQSYQQSYTQGWSSNRDMRYEDGDDGTPGAFPDAAVVRSGEEEMILFPSYSRKHIKKKPQAEPGTIQETPGDGRDVRDSVGAGDAEFWKQQWEAYEDDNAIVDVDVRGWIYSPHKGQLTRKHRLFVGVARSLVGINAPPAKSSDSSRNPSPHSGHQERAARRDEDMVAKEADAILMKGEKEGAIAAKGGYSEAARDDDSDSPYDSPAQHSRKGSHQLKHAASLKSLNSLKDDDITPLQKRQSWNQPANMSPTELTEANNHLMARLKPFMSNPMANEPISVFFYNEDTSKQRTVYTNAAGHFNVRAALDFIPTHVRIIASERLSATTEVVITDPTGISLISDIDDTIKHSAIGSGAREIFRNAFIRELGDLTIEGVTEWYNRMADMGVKFHYVSNSPWQLYPVLTKFFTLAGLPSGSFHLKQYNGMLQGIFEPVAERKKGTLDKIARDFPERSFILVGDSGEADLEVYTDFVQENPGRVLAVFIRDVTTPTFKGGFFDSSMGPLTGERSSSTGTQGGRNGRATASLTPMEEDDDPHLKAAISASLKDMERENKKGINSWPHEEDSPERRPQLPPRRSTQPRQPEPQENLIDFSDGEQDPGFHNQSPLRRVHTSAEVEDSEKRKSVASTSSAKSMPPKLPRKPVALRSTSNEEAPLASSTTSSKPPIPPKPRRPSNSIHGSSPLTNQVQTQSPKPRPAQKPPTERAEPSYSYRDSARQKLASAYNNLPSASSYLYGTPQDQTSPTSDSVRSMSTSSEASTKRTAPPPPPPRRAIASYPVAAASYASSKVQGAWSGGNPAASSNLNISQSQSNAYSTTSSQQYPSRNNDSTLGTNGGNGGGNGQGMNKKEQLWRQRWARAEQILGDKGVLLRSWRVGSDVMDEAVKIVEKANERREYEGSRERSDKRKK
ncbi:uncharacterized protein BDZ99DRAFT_571750 [Mytilinidion resinicola]|uniref:Phosphatidate phosphatase APP1 catalytic domain-containing protein n=1 Tax=Mytilinidion resinicola TaxID=574789 RepID=A0A6A6YLN3_9PEZI|nr:uncharacterized protein BDZ99DRAFT_571750 [Mytilinidion resinicola]KAF2808894.1 hypothetical protein BDZ99DRAFT_571750 [Mytilinidion resinicola]